MEIRSLRWRAASSWGVGLLMAESNPNAKPEKLSLVKRGWAAYLNNRRRLGSAVALAVALVLAWHVVNGRNGLTSWQKKRAEDKSLAAEIERGHP